MSGIPLFLCHLRFPFHIRDELIKLSFWSSFAVLFQYKEKSPANQCLPSYDDASGRIRTCTWITIQRPERCASANSATEALTIL